MRILTVMNLYPPHSFGGYEDLCAGAVRDWRAAGHQVRVLTSRWRRDDVGADAPAPDGEPVDRTLPLYWDDHRQLFPPAHTAARWERRSRAAIGRTLDTFVPDVLSVWNPAALSFSLFDLARDRGLPVVLVLGDRWLEFGPAADGWRARFLPPDGPSWRDRVLAQVLRLPSAPPLRRLGSPVVACFASDHLRQHAVAEGDWVFDDIAIVPHGLDLARFPPHGRTTDRWGGRLLYVGRVVPEKGVDTAVAALAATPEATLTIVGTGPATYRLRLQRQVAELGLAARVTLAGEQGPAELLASYRAADALVFPSRWSEPFGLVPLEAMACGLPVLATGTGGSGEFLVDGTTCLRFPAGDHDALASVIHRMGGDADLRSRLRANGHRLSRHLDRRTTFAELADWLAHAAAGLAGPRPPERPVLPDL